MKQKTNSRSLLFFVFLIIAPAVAFGLGKAYGSLRCDAAANRVLYLHYADALRDADFNKSALLNKLVILSDGIEKAKAAGPSASSHLLAAESERALINRMISERWYELWSYDSRGEKLIFVRDSEKSLSVKSRRFGIPWTLLTIPTS